MTVQRFAVRGILAEGRLVGDGARGFMGADPAVVLPPGEVPQALSGAAEPRDERRLFPAQQIREGADTGFFQRALGNRAHAPDQADRLVPQKGRRVRHTDHGKPLRLVEVGRHFCQKLVVAEADGAGQPQFSLHPLHQTRKHHRGGCAMQAGGARHVEEGLI